MPGPGRLRSVLAVARMPGEVPLKPRYCRECGAPVARVEEPAPGRPVVVVCPECGSREGQRPPVSAAGVLLRRLAGSGPEVLLVRLRADAAGKGAGYTLPSRVVEWGEDARDTVLRAFWELAGLRVRVRAAYDVHSNFSDAEDLTVDAWFRVEVRGEQEPVPGSDAEEVRWQPLDRLPELIGATDQLVLERIARDGQEGAEAPGPDLAARLHRQKRKYRELLEAYSNELMRGAWVNDLHHRLAKLETAAEVAGEATRQIAERPEVDVARIWRLGPPDRCETCPWADRCPRERCLHLVASAADRGDASGETPAPPPRPEPELERIPPIHGVPAADVALQDAPHRAELPGAGARPRRFEGFPLGLGEALPGVLGLVSEEPMEPGARRLFGVVAHHVGTLMRNARLVDELRLANQVKLGFIARMSHELKTPLTAILGYADLLKAELMAEGHTLGADGAATIEESGRKLLDIVETILELAKLQNGAMRLRTERVSLREVAEELLPRYGARARERGIELVLATRRDGGDDEMVWADRGRAREVLDHLLDNAVKFTERGKVVVELEPGEARVTCRVRDTGIGIAPEHRERAFDAFYQASEKIHIDFGGLGIGLSLARMKVEAMQGAIGVEPNPGGGSIFWFTLPRE